jgi:hypothetical protein
MRIYKTYRMYVVYFLTVVLLFSGMSAAGAEEVKTMTVDEAVSIALEENLNLKLQQSEVESGRGAELVEQGVFDPRIEAGSSHPGTADDQPAGRRSRRRKELGVERSNKEETDNRD